MSSKNLLQLKKEFTRYKLKQTVNIDQKTESMCTKFSPDNFHFCVGGFDGHVRIFSAKLDFKTTADFNSQMTDGQDLKSPVTSITFRPINNQFTAKNVILVTCSDGNVMHWHVGSQKELHSMREEGNETYAADYSPDGLFFATAGKDETVRLYDEERRKLIDELTAGRVEGTKGHNSRIQCLKFISDSLILTGGWDNTIQIWDVRQRSSVRSIYGPFLCGDALDFKDDKILTGSCRRDKQIEIWDLGTGDKMHEIPFPVDPSQNDMPKDQQGTELFCCKFSSDGTKVAAGGKNDFRVFETSTGRVIGDLFGADPKVQHCVYTAAFNADDSMVVAGGADQKLFVLEGIAQYTNK